MQIISKAALLNAVHLAHFMEDKTKMTFPVSWRCGV